MRVFISWSGERSKAVAQILKDRLPLVINSVDPWLSTADIEAGARWATDLATGLEETDFGILCLTSENLLAPWLLFEAGALSKRVGESRVTPYLLDLKPTDIQLPLGQFQAVTANRDGTHKLVTDLAKAARRLNQVVLTDEQLGEQFADWWPRLESQIESIPEAMTQPKIKRPQQELIEEILFIVRSLGTRIDHISEREFTEKDMRAVAGLIAPFAMSEEISRIADRRDALESEISDIEALIENTEDDETRDMYVRELKELRIAHRKYGEWISGFISQLR